MRGEGNRARALAAAVSLALAAAGCASRGARPAPAGGTADQTRLLYERNCAVCHGPRGEGKQLGTMKVPTLLQGAPVSDPDARLFKQIYEGGNGMPPFKYTLADAQIEDLVRFVREELQGKKRG